MGTAIACGYQSIHAQTMITAMPQLHSLTRASMPKPEQGPCSNYGRLTEHPCQTHNNAQHNKAHVLAALGYRVPTGFGYQRNHANSEKSHMCWLHSLAVLEMMRLPAITHACHIRAGQAGRWVLNHRKGSFPCEILCPNEEILLSIGDISK